MNLPESHPADLPAPSLFSQRAAALHHWFGEVRWQAIGLAIAVLIVYAPTFRFEFLNWDDRWYIVWNDLIRSWHPANLYRILTEPVARNFAPATIATFLVEHSLWQLWPGGYHATNVLIHLVNTVLVLQLLRQLTRDEWLAWTVAILFAVHPVQVESVAWISSRKTVLSATWMLASCLCWLRPNRTSRDEAWGIGWLVLALLCKAAAVIIPPIVIAYDVLIARKKFWDSVVHQAIPLFCCVMLIFVTMNAQVTIVGGIRGHLQFSKLRILAIDLTLLWRYVGMLISPQDLCVLYDPPVEGIAFMVVLAALGWGVVCWLLWRVRQSHPLLTLAGITWILLFLPVLNLFPLTTLMNDRYLYLPCVPFFAMACWGFHSCWQMIVSRFPRLFPAQAAVQALASTVMVGVMTWGTLNYLPIWRDPVSLWSYARTQQPQMTMVQIQWALTLKDLGRFEEARRVLDEAVRSCHPDEGELQLIESIRQKIETRSSSVSA